MKLKPSPLAPKSFPDLPELDGIQKWVAETGAKYKDRPDVLLVKFGEGSQIAGVFTRSNTPGAPVDWSRQRLAEGADKGLLVTAGNANVFTGAQGKQDVKTMAGYAGHLLGCAAEDVYICSTGVIGEPMDLGPLSETFKTNSFLQTEASWQQAAQAISTTDTYTKGAKQTCQIGNTPITLCGIAKGSGMIAPNMATMLVYMFTDANIEASVLQSLLSEHCETTFNAITVDSDTSTSDTVLLAATGKAGHARLSNISAPELKAFSRALHALMRDLAHQVVKDGEGATKFIEVSVCGAETDKSAKTIALSIANSPLVKTAIAGEDANWGRIVMAVGKSGEKVIRERLRINFGPHLVAENAQRSETYRESVLSSYMRSPHIDIQVDIGVGSGHFTVWTCDLTHGYIDINADYRS